ncbi:MAG: hypothetical protein IPJ34_17225 [Myxococcales bacterium]|nr:hypothetical protein [Myxococcales bacterium]
MARTVTSIVVLESSTPVDPSDLVAWVRGLLGRAADPSELLENTLTRVSALLRGAKAVEGPHAAADATVLRELAEALAEFGPSPCEVEAIEADQAAVWASAAEGAEVVQ